MSNAPNGFLRMGPAFRCANAPARSGLPAARPDAAAMVAAIRRRPSYSIADQVTYEIAILSFVFRSLTPFSLMLFSKLL